MIHSADSEGGSTPVLVIVMGVSGAGKSTVAQALAEHRGFRYLDADDYHSDQARTQMAAGHPLTDTMREPWIESICRHLRELANQNANAVLAFSGLKKIHREPLRHCGFEVIFLFLDGDRETIAERIRTRTGHFMSPSLLDSQFESLERPDAEADVYPLDIKPALPQLLHRANDIVDRHRSC